MVLRLHLEGGLQALLGQSTLQRQAWGRQKAKWKMRWTPQPSKVWMQRTGDGTSFPA